MHIILDRFIHLSQQFYLPLACLLVQIYFSVLFEVFELHISLLDLNLPEKQTFLPQLLLKIIDPFKTVLLVIPEQSTVRTDLPLIGCTDDVHDHLVLPTYLCSLRLCLIKRLVVEQTNLMFPNVGRRSRPLAVVLPNRQPHLFVEGQLLHISNGLLAELAENDPIIGGFNVQIAGMTDIVPALEHSGQPFSRKYKKTLVTLQLVTHSTSSSQIL